jgi:MFS family permease
MRASIVGALIVAQFALADTVIGQSPLREGSRLRVTPISVSTPAQIVQFQALNDSALVVSSGGSSRMIPLRDIGRLEQSAGRKPNLVTGAIGLLLGAAIGGVVACADNRDSYGVFCAGQNDTKVAVGAAIGGVTGGALGAYLFRRERWAPVDLRTLR